MAKPAKTQRKIAQTRYENFVFAFQSFKDRYPGPGVVARFAKELGFTPTFLSQIKNHHKPIGNATAAEIETKLGMPPGWMDVEHPDLKRSSGSGERDELRPRDAAEARQVRKLLHNYRQFEVEGQVLYLDMLDEALEQTVKKITALLKQRKRKGPASD